MRFYIHASPFTGKKRLVIESNLLGLLPKNRGMALRFAIWTRIPSKPGMWVTSTTGSKRLGSILNHEHKHCDRMAEYGTIKWIYKYYTDKEFHEYEERLAREAESYRP